MTGALALAAALVGLPLSLIWALYWTWEVLEEVAPRWDE